MAYEFPETIVSDSLDANKFDHVWKDLILPRLGGFHRAGPIESEILGNGAEGTAQLKLIDGNGNPVNIDINVDATDSGPKAEVLSKLIFSWVVMNVVDRHKAFSTRLRAEACVVGLKKDRAYLEGMGIRGVSERNVVKGTMEFATWDDLLSRWSHELDSDK